MREIKEMYEKQDRLNRATCGNDWVKGVCCSKKEINWEEAILDETAELLNSTSWKWWKNQIDDPENLRIELVDLWHFVMSFHMEQAFLFHIVIDYKEVLHLYEISEPKTIMQLIKSESNSYAYLMNLFGLMKTYEMDLEELYGIYQAKNWLNGFRIKNGYAEGTYTKNLPHKSGSNVLVEDNRILMSFVREIGLEAAFLKFEQVYRENERQNGNK